jgi:glycosyltransferase involved in cell wall biosynthesis
LGRRHVFKKAYRMDGSVVSSVNEVRIGAERAAGLRVLQVSAGVGMKPLRGGGSSAVAWNLHGAYRERGLDAWMAVGAKEGRHERVSVIPNDSSRSAYARLLLNWENSVASSDETSNSFLRRTLRFSAEPVRRWRIWNGEEDFEFPGTGRLFHLPGGRPDLLHLHLLQGGYFDLRALPWLSTEVPTIVTLHDAWLLSGHCSHSLGCNRWTKGCGNCPDLKIYPEIRRDATAENWARKQSLFKKSSLYVAAPSQWMMDQAMQSMLTPAIRGTRIIPNGVDLRAFKPGDKLAARSRLGISSEVRVLCFAASGIRKNAFKDWQTLAAAVELLSSRATGAPVLLLAVGEEAPGYRVGRAEVRFVPFTDDLPVLANYYRASDVYVHASLAESFGNVIVEALACGTPVVATNVGAIPEIVRQGVTGLLVPPKDPTALAAAVERLLFDPYEATGMGQRGAIDAKTRFGLGDHVDAYLQFYGEAQSDFANRRSKRS